MASNTKTLHILEQTKGSDHLEDATALEKGDAQHAEHAGSNQDAIAAERAQHEMGAWEAFRTHPQAVFWSFVMSMCIVMESYDLLLVGNLMAQPAFAKRFGEYVNEEVGYAVTANWQSLVNQAGTIGSFVGVLICPFFIEPLGYRKTVLIVFAESMAILFVGEIMCGIPWGFFINIAPAYASEVAPLPLRAHLTIFIQICWCLGNFIASGILFGLQSRTDKWAYKLPFMIQWIWPVALLITLWFAPESPWWLVRKGRLEEARKVVVRLGGKSKQNPDDEVALMVRTDDLERLSTEGASYTSCFKGSDRRRTMIVCLMFGFQNLSGLLIGNQSTYFFQQAGLPSQQAFGLTVGNTGIQFVAVIICVFLTSKLGRRPLYLFGMGFNTIFLLITGIVASVPRTSTTTWIQSVFLILIYFMYGLTVGPITYAVIAETSSIRLRSQSVALARNFYYIVAIGTGFINTYALNPTAWGLAGKSSYIWCATAACCTVSAYFFLPELNGRTYRELDILFHRQVPARKFKSTVINLEDDE